MRNEGFIGVKVIGSQRDLYAIAISEEAQRLVRGKEGVSYNKKRGAMGLKAFLELKGCSQRQLSRDTGISTATVSRKVSGESELLVKGLQKIWEVYGPLSDEEAAMLLALN